MIDRLLYRITDRLPCKIIAEADKPYLERYFLFRIGGFQCYLHRFVASDPDRGLHDQPWGLAVSILLAGKYRELRRAGVRNVRWANIIRGDDFHRVLLEKEWESVDCSNGIKIEASNRERSCWTLFMHGSQVKKWGFLRPIPTTPGSWIYREHNSSNGVSGTEDRWWLTAAKGRDTARREALL